MDVTRECGQPDEVSEAQRSAYPALNSRNRGTEGFLDRVPSADLEIARFLFRAPECDAASCRALLAVITQLAFSQDPIQLLWRASFAKVGVAISTARNAARGWTDV